MEKITISEEGLKGIIEQYILYGSEEYDFAISNTKLVWNSNLRKFRFDYVLSKESVKVNQSLLLALWEIKAVLDLYFRGKEFKVLDFDIIELENSFALDLSVEKIKILN